MKNNTWINRTLDKPSNTETNGKIDANILLFIVNAILIGTAIFSYYIQTL